MEIGAVMFKIEKVWRLCASTLHKIYYRMKELGK